MRTSTFARTLLGATALSLTIPTMGWAQSSVEEVVVTARKREESLQEVPVAVSSLSGDQLQQQGIRNTQDLGRTVPNLRATGHPSSASIVIFTIRGQKSGDVLTTVDQAVGVYSDGVYVPRPRGMNGAFFDMERVEVLKGPQGTLYGRNTTGGAINLISRGADYSGVHGYVGGELGSESLRAVRAAVNVPLVDDKLAVRLGYQRTLRDGFGRSAVTGQKIGQDRDQHLVRAMFRADPVENVNVVLKGEFFRTRENGNLFTPIGLTPGIAPGVPPFAVLAAAAQLGTTVPNAQAFLLQQMAAGNADYDTTFYEHLQHDWFEGWNVGLTFTVDLADNVQLKSISGFRRFVNDQLFDLDGTSLRLLSVGVGRFPDGPEVRGAPGLPPTAFQMDAGPEQRDRFFSQEFNLSGTTLGDRIRWLGGVYYSHEIGSDTQHAQALPPLLRNSFIHDGMKILNESWSLYTQEEFAITDKLTLQLGGRYTQEHKFLKSRSRNFFPDGGPGGIPPNSITCLTGVPGVFPASEINRCFTNNERTFDGFSWMVGASYQVSPDMLVYARSAEGFRGGAFQLRSPILDPAGPETATETELGVKSDWLDGRLRVNLAGFRTVYNNKQESIIVTQPGGNSATVIQNAADAKLHGFEGELTANPVEGLTLRATVGYLKGKYKRFPGALPVNGGAPVDASGERFSDPP